MISVLEPRRGGADCDLEAKVREIFSSSGLLSRARHFEFRPQQQSMAIAVARALERGEHLLVEAGTGVGKSLAYLIPSVLYAVSCGKKAIVSTHTINLQEQLTQKDLPLMAEILPVKFAFALLKGRSNYLCTRRLRKALQHAEGLFTTREATELKRIERWSRSTRDGSLSDFAVEPGPKVWAQVCSERGLCSPKQCGYRSAFADEHRVCFFQQARSRILSADVLVLNHTLFFTLLASMEDTPPEGILFRNDFVVFDESHRVEQVASRHIGVGVSQGQLRFALHRLWNRKTRKGLLATLQQVKTASQVEELESIMDTFFGRVESACSEMKARERVGQRLAGRDWSELRIRGPDLVQDNLSLPIERLRQAVRDLAKDLEDRDLARELTESNRRLGELRESIALFLGQEQEDFVYWVERRSKAPQRLSLNAAPVDVSSYLRRRLFGGGTSIVMTSATLALAPSGGAARHTASPGSQEDASGALAYFGSRVGGERAAQTKLGSPFDFQRQMRIYVVSKIPDPRDAAFREALAHWIKHFVHQSHGKAFVLFTNIKLMHRLSEELRPFFETAGLGCLVQGRGVPRSRLLEQFKEDVDSVLFGTDSFWQGVDVPGEALTNVIITRLPFAVPEHPLTEARIERIEARGGNAFLEYTLPEAVLKFRQGVGRLIRSKTDQGMIAVLDNRILLKRYGRVFLDALPKCPVECV